MAKAPPRRILWEGGRPEAAEGALVEANSDAFALLRGPRGGGGGVSARVPRSVAKQVCCSSAHGVHLPPCKGGAFAALQEGCICRPARGVLAAHRAHGLHPKQPARPPAGARVRRSARVAGLGRCPARGELKRVALPLCRRGEQRARGVDAGEGAWRGEIEINTRNRNGSCCSILELVVTCADAQRPTASSSRIEGPRGGAAGAPENLAPCHAAGDGEPEPWNLRTKMPVSPRDGTEPAAKPLRATRRPAARAGGVSD
jgi:hypothetical protein